MLNVTQIGNSRAGATNQDSWAPQPTVLLGLKMKWYDRPWTGLLSSNVEISATKQFHGMSPILLLCTKDEMGEHACLAHGACVDSMHRFPFLPQNE